MIDEFKIEDSKIKQIIFVVTPYAFLCAILYLYSFWSRFHINFFEFITFANLLIVSVYPIVGSILSFVIGAIIGQAVPGKKEISKKQVKWHLAFYSLGLVLITLQTSLVFGWQNLYHWMPVLIAFWVSISLTKLFLSKNINVPFVLSFLIIFLPLISYGTGAEKSLNILQNISVRYAKTSQFDNYELFGSQARIKFIGLGGKHYFFISEDNSNLYILNSDSINSLELSKPSSKKFEPPMAKLKKWFNKKLID